MDGTNRKSKVAGVVVAFLIVAIVVEVASGPNSVHVERTRPAIARYVFVVESGTVTVAENSRPRPTRAHRPLSGGMSGFVLLLFILVLN